MQYQHHAIDISLNSVVRVVAIAAVVFFLLFMWKVLAALFLALVIASSIEPLIQLVCKYRIPRFLTVVLLYVFFLAVLGGIFYVVLPNILFEFRAMSADLPDRYQELAGGVNAVFGFTFLPEFHGSQFAELFNAVTSRFGVGAEDIFTFAVGVFEIFFSLFLVFILSFYLTIQDKGVEHFILSLTPAKSRPYLLGLWRRIQGKMSRWLGAQVILVFFIFATLFPILWGLGVKYALVLALIAGLLEIIPVIGPLTAGIVIYLFVLMQSPSLALLAILTHVTLEQIQQHFVVPTVVSRAIGLNPVFIIIFLLSGGALAGIWGAFLAIPAGIVLMELFADFKSRDAQEQ